MKDVVVLDACRTAVGKFGGTLKPLHAYELACRVVDQTLERAGVDKKEVDEVILGQCRQNSDESNLARLVALKVGIPETATGHTVMRQCASAMTAVHNGTMQIMCGLSDVVVAGGAESMTNGIFYIRNARYGVGTGNVELIDSVTEGQFSSQPQDIYGRFNMGTTADNVAKQMNISREDQDVFAFNSQKKAIAAIDAGKFKDEIVPISVPQGKKKDPIIFDTDEFPRRDITMEGLQKLKPAFDRENGTVTAGNACGRNDGASAMLLASREKAEALGVKPIARIIGMGTAGCDPRVMGLGPVYAVPKALDYAGISMDQIGLVELNEAFAAQSLGCIRGLGWENKMDIINVNGGAIALGHPVGSSGCRIIVTLIHEMKKRGVQYGLATLCIAGGMGQATVVELL